MACEGTGSEIGAAAGTQSGAATMRGSEAVDFSRPSR
jgi:hypothetical protein